jgi:adenosylhomocysteinase
LPPGPHGRKAPWTTVADSSIETPDSDGGLDSVVEHPVDDRPGAFFRQLVGSMPIASSPAIVAVAHMVPNSRHFLPALDSIGSLALVLMKPHSVNEEVRAELESKFPTRLLSRQWAADPSSIIRAIDEHVPSRREFVLVDIGGYFADALPAIASYFGTTFRGALEGTANGIAKYKRSGASAYAPLISVADSSLKYPENHLIGASVVYSVEAVLRDNGQVLQGYQAAVLGFGRVGRSVAAALRGRGISTFVFDSDAVALAEAAAHGYPVSRQLSGVLSAAGIVICSTGNQSLRGGDFGLLRDGAYVATVTSGDDELDLAALEQGYVIKPHGPHLTRYASANKCFYLINEGQAVNFLHSAVVGPAIQLIEGEKLAGVITLASSTLDPGVHDVDDSLRRVVAAAWLDHFLPSS